MTFSNLMKMAESSSRWVENSLGKGKIALFPAVFSKDLYCRYKIQGLFGQGLKTQRRVFKMCGERRKMLVTSSLLLPKISKPIKGRNHHLSWSKAFFFAISYNYCAQLKTDLFI